MFEHVGIKNAQQVAACTKVTLNLISQKTIQAFEV